MKKILAAAAVLVSFNAFAGGNIDAGKAATEKYNCFSCHGKDYNTPIDPSYPKLAGQHEDYLAAALTAYKRGGDGANGRGNAIMGAQVKPLSTQDIKDIAAYLHSLPGTLVLRK
ncbi:c-type cytochrome [Noviherbaspirillum denitrificans]|uniref:Cytochrome C n=1 Tax=Noviherbaspirillum denitrificans TaxID=1968433 RepID=A0A254TAI8_9BURK|nr:cytochrome c [Noviherbaspirillum denitrificans]OWW19666.1 cytochrome C [Noviherbaspirillum denitrificans]